MKRIRTQWTNETRATVNSHYSQVILTAALSVLIFMQLPLYASEMDDKIVTSAKQSYVFKVFLIEDSITTDSKDGSVTLTGTVSEESHKRLAQDTVSGLPGVKSVDNQLIVKDSPPERSDTWLYMKVKSALAIHRSVNAFKTKVELKQGVVTLTGVASSQAQRDLAAEYAKDVEGVKEVKNEMTVSAVPPLERVSKSVAEIIDDASITAQVKMSLWTHRSTSALKTSVSTTEGVVTLSGTANNVAELDLVNKLVNDINGVKSVVNQMAVTTVPTAK